MDLAAGAARYVREAGRLFLGNGDGVLVLIEVYMDESGTHTDSQVVIVGAAWASTEVWAEWTLDWCNTKPPINVFHATDCHNRVGEFTSWSPSDRDDYVIRLLPVIARHDLRMRIAGLDRQELNRSLSHRLDVVDWLGDPYHICFQWAVSRVWQALDAMGHNEIAFVHENNDYMEVASETFRYLHAKFPSRSATLSFGSKHQFIPLQCADILAFEGNRQLRNFHGPVRKPLLAIDPDGRRLSFHKYDKSEIGQISEFLIQSFERWQVGAG